MTTINEFPAINNIDSITKNGDDWKVRFLVAKTELNRYKVGSYRHGFKMTEPKAKQRIEPKEFSITAEIAKALNKMAKAAGFQSQQSTWSDNHVTVSYLA